MVCHLLQGEQAAACCAPSVRDGGAFTGEAARVISVTAGVQSDNDIQKAFYNCRLT